VRDTGRCSSRRHSTQLLLLLQNCHSFATCLIASSAEVAGRAKPHRLVHVAVELVDIAVWRQEVAQCHHLQHDTNIRWVFCRFPPCCPVMGVMAAAQLVHFGFVK
jgi:hypothetical protein